MSAKTGTGVDIEGVGPIERALPAYHNHRFLNIREPAHVSDFRFAYLRFSIMLLLENVDSMQARWLAKQTQGCVREPGMHTKLWPAKNPG